MPNHRERERFCVLMPAYCEEERIHWVVKGALQFCNHVVVVDDGSSDATADEAEKAGAVVLRSDKNRGKGVALRRGFEYAREKGFDYLITMDADGQHAPEDISRFVEAYVRTGVPVLIGNRMGDARLIPLVRRLTNYAMTWLLNRHMRWYVPDTQCGFRLYRCDVIPYVAARSRWRAADSEILLHIAARAIRIDVVPVQVIYAADRSRLTPFRDAFRFLVMMWRFGRHRKWAAARFGAGR